MDIPKEIEVKVIGCGSLEELEKKLIDIGAKKIAGRDLIRDRYFKFNNEGHNPAIITEARGGEDGSSVLFWRLNDDEYSVSVPDDISKLRQMLIFLGLSLDGGAPSMFKERSVRLRQEHKKWVWTVKAKRQKGANIDNRHELEIRVSGPEEVISFLNACGYNRDNYLEKYRTEYHLGKIKFMIDECPGIDPYLEVEGETEGQVFEQVRALGFSQSQTMAVSSKYIGRLAGISEEHLSDWRFN